jgi:hypothetical protein
MAKQTSVWIKEAMGAGLEMPKEIQAFIKKKHGKVIARTYISTRKKMLRAQMGQTSPTSTQPKASMPAAFNKTAASKVRHKSSNGDLVGALKAVQEAAAKVGGIGRLMELVEVLGKMN